MADAARAALDEGLRRFGERGDAPDEDVDSEIFDKVRRGLVQTKNDAGALDTVNDAMLRDLLLFCVQVGSRRKASRPRGLEALKLLLARRRCRDAVQRYELRADLQEFVKDDADALALLEPPPLEEQAGASAGSTAVPSAPTVDPKDLEQQLAAGVQVMQKFGFEFPSNDISQELDEATQGFTQFFNAVQKLGLQWDRTTDREALRDTVRNLDNRWPKILSFLSGMYRRRHSHSGRIRNVVDSLSKLSPSFQACLDRTAVENLPWLTEEDVAAITQADKEQLARHQANEVASQRTALALDASEKGIIEVGIPVLVTEDASVLERECKALEWNWPNGPRGLPWVRKLGKFGEVNTVDLKDQSVKVDGDVEWVPIRALQGFEQWTQQRQQKQQRVRPSGRGFFGAGR